MSKFILECTKGKFTMSFIDEFLPTATMECNSCEEAAYEMIYLLRKRVESNNPTYTESLRSLKDDINNGKLQIDLIGINMINSDNLRSDIANQIKDIVNEYEEYLIEIG